MKHEYKKEMLNPFEQKWAPQKILTGITIYPIKSTAGLSLAESAVYAEGLARDRRWAIINQANAIITPREHPKLLTIHTSITHDALCITVPHALTIPVPLTPGSKHLLPVTVFDVAVYGNHISEADAFLSAYLGMDCRLIFMDKDCVRYVKPMYGGSGHDLVSYADSAPLLLTTTATLDALNARMPRSMNMNRFRPNLVVSGCDAHEEYSWKEISIGEVRFRVSEACKRCMVTTLDPVTTHKSSDQEPLRTLATYAHHARGGVRFGISLIPLTRGVVREGDEIKVIAIDADGNS